MMIGEQKTWVINAKASVKGRFIGTEFSIGLKRGVQQKRMWQRLEDMAKRYAAPNSTVRVYYLHDQSEIEG